MMDACMDALQTSTCTFLYLYLCIHVFVGMDSYKRLGVYNVLVAQARASPAQSMGCWHRWKDLQNIEQVYGSKARLAWHGSRTIEPTCIMRIHETIWHLDFRGTFIFLTRMLSIIDPPLLTGLDPTQMHFMKMCYDLNQHFCWQIRLGLAAEPSDRRRKWSSAMEQFPQRTVEQMAFCEAGAALGIGMLWTSSLS